MKRIGLSVLVLAAVLICGSRAMACYITGRVVCDVNTNGQIDPGDTPLANVLVYVEGLESTIHATTGADGSYALPVVYDHRMYNVRIDEATLPIGSRIVIPSGGVFTFEYTGTNPEVTADFLIDSPTCRESACWMTGGGVKFEPVTGTRNAEFRRKGGPTDTVGGNVYPSCSQFPGNGGNWNHVAHSLKLHLSGKDQIVLRCGNVDGHPPGTDSPVCDVNYIEWIGIGTVQGVGGNKFGPVAVSYFARVEDRNEPGNEQSATSGGDVDRYYLRVVDGSGNLLMLVDADGVDDGAIDPLTITGGNFQIHCTSCD